MVEKDAIPVGNNAVESVTKDMNKGISDIQYNLLNLPRQMDIKNPVAEARNEYTYSASGQKLKVVQKWNPNYATAPVVGSAINTSSLTSSKTTEYAGNMIYEDGTLKRILIDGGYIEGGQYFYYVTDHQGNNRLVVNASGSAIQKNHYYPFGVAFAETPIAEQGKQPYKYNGKELDQMNGLNWYDYSARNYDPAYGRFTTMDPMCEKYYSISPYAYCANNPVRFIDPDGQDWYGDFQNLARQFNPNLNKNNQAEILEKGQKYIGATDQVKDEKGNVIENYRKDGSIMYSNETDAYNRMWSQANKVNREQLAVIGDENVLVLPEYLNDNTTSEVEKYGYSWKNGNITDADGNTFSTIATIHTHQDDLKGKWGFIAAPGFDDQKYFSYRTPDKPYFTMGYNGKIYGEIGNSKGRQILSNIIPKGYNTVNDLLKGAKFQLLIKSLK
ncbi:MAG: RHS repeat-associated core domain-containing protein [Candidatus Azobacteroides sp.]|nr:RHS repeat-associated core domain-containing protein [Candidatus Azobacteroides sp.]